MCEKKRERYDYKNARWVEKTMQCMWILNTNDAWKKKIGQKSKNWKFSNFDQSSINWTLIELGKRSSFENLTFSIDQKIDSIDWDS